jgi:hypothetical protein
MTKKPDIIKYFFGKFLKLFVVSIVNNLHFCFVFKFYSNISLGILIEECRKEAKWSFYLKNTGFPRYSQ